MNKNEKILISLIVILVIIAFSIVTLLVVERGKEQSVISNMQPQIKNLEIQPKQQEAVEIQQKKNVIEVEGVVSSIGDDYIEIQNGNTKKIIPMTANDEIVIKNRMKVE